MSDTHATPDHDPSLNDAAPAKSGNGQAAPGADEGQVDLRLGGAKPRQPHTIDPDGGAPAVPWTELLKQPRGGSEDEVALGSLPELQIDAITDNEVIQHLKQEAGKSGILHKLATNSSKLIKGGAGKEPPRDAPAKKPGPAKMFSPQPPAQDWFKDLNSNDSGSSIDLMTAAQDAANPLQDSSFRRRVDDSDIISSAMHTDDGTSRVNLGMEPRGTPLASNPSWKALEETARPAPAKPAPVQRRPPSRNSVNVRPTNKLASWLGGPAIAVAGAAVLGLGVWLGSMLPSRGKPVAVNTVSAADAAPRQTPELAHHYLEGGDPEKALEVYFQCEESPAVLAGRGQARWLTYLRQQKQKKAALAENDVDVARARKDLVESRSAEGTLWLGLINEAFRQFDAAREAYDLGRDNYPGRLRLFAAARSRLDAMTASPGKKVAVRVDPQLGMALALTMMEMPAEAGGVNPADEAGFDFWEAVAFARRGDFAAGRNALLRARAIHEQRRDVIVRLGQNPDSDPREEIFLHTCDQMLAYWDVEGKLQSAGFRLDGVTPGQAIDTLLANQKKFDEAMKVLTATLKTDKLEEIAPALDAVMKHRQEAVDKWKAADDAARRAEEALKSARGDLAKRDEQFVALQKSAADDLKRALAQEAAVRKALDEATTARRTAEDTYQALHARLLKAKLVTEKSAPADLVKALDTLLATGPDAKDLELARLRALLDEARKAPALPAPAAVQADPELADKLFSEGVQLYYARHYAEAEEQLVAAHRSNERDARILYFLGLARLPQGKSAAADEDFRRAAALERQGLPDAGTISTLIERIQGPERQVINRYRR